MYDLIESRYTELLERERSMGNNILEAEGLDLDARVIAKLEVLPAREGKQSIFNEPVYLEIVDAKARRKPMTTLEAINAVRLELGFQPVQDKAEHDFEEIRERAWDQIGDRIERMQALIPLHRAAFEERVKVEVLTDKKVKTPADRPARVERRLAHYDVRSEENLEELTRAFEKLLPGQTVYVHDRKTKSVHYGIVEGFSNRSLEQGDPVLPSNWKIHILSADSVRRMSIPMSRVNQNYEIGFTIEPALTTWQGKNIYELFDERQSLSREVRQVFTGNVLRAFEKFSGRLVNYTESDGNLKQGMLMGHDFDLAKQLEQEPVVFPTAAKAKAYLDEIGVELTTGDTDLTIHPPNRSQDAYVLSVYPGKQGAKYHADEALLSAMDSEFVSVGGWMKATVDPERMIQTLDYLIENSGIVADKYKEKARQFLGVEIPTTREILNAASAEVFKEGAPPLSPESKGQQTNLLETGHEAEEKQPESTTPEEQDTAIAQDPAQDLEKPAVVQFANAQELPPTWEERRRELIEVNLLPEKFVEALHKLDLIRADGFGDRPYEQLSLPGVATGTQEAQHRGFWFQIGREHPNRVLLTDSPMEALSASVGDRRPKQGGTVYMGDPEALPKEMLRQFSQQGGTLYAAYGSDIKGELKAWELAREIPHIQRLRPESQSWANSLQKQPHLPNPQSWLRLTKALEHRADYRDKVAQIISAPLSVPAQTAFERDVRSHRQLQEKLWSWHQAARETNAGPKYLNRIVDVALSFNGEDPQPLSAEAKQAMAQVEQYHQRQSQTASTRNIELEAG